MEKEIIYLKLEQKKEICNPRVFIQDIAKIYCKNSALEKKVNQLEFMKITEKQNYNYVCSILKVIEVIEKHCNNVEVVNMGEKDFILSYVPIQKKSRAMEWLKIISVCAIISVGAAFSIMTFNTDVSVAEVFERSYELFFGKGAKSNGVVEMAYCIGLPIGITVFFNHLSKRAIKEDPTPLQVEMRKYEEDTNKAVIKNASREGKMVDAH